MNPDKYFFLLLQIDKKLIVNGLGIFELTPTPAAIHPVHHSFDPPGAVVSFTPDDTISDPDNKLVNFAAAQDNNLKSVTLHTYTLFASEVKNNLYSHGRHVFEGYGTLVRQEEATFVFEAVAGLNLNADAAGLESFTSPAIIRETKKAKPVERKRKRISAWVVLLIIIFVLAGGISAAWFVLPDYRNKAIVFAEEQYNALRGKFSSKKSEPAENEKENKEKEDNKNKKSLVDMLNKTVSDLGDSLKTIVDTSTSTTQTEEIATPPFDGTKMYYIVAGSFKSKENAEKYVGELKASDFPNAVMLGEPKNGFYTVAYAGYADKTQADKELKRINNERQAGSWLIYQ